MVEKPHQKVIDKVIRELPPIGKYRIRLIENTKKPGKSVDIREYVTGETFEGFTRRGIRLTLEQATLLQVTLADLLKELQHGTTHP